MKLPGILSKIMSAGAGLVALRTCCCCGRALGDGERAMCAVCMMELPRTGMHLGPGGRIRAALDNAVAPAGIGAAWFHYDPSSPFADLIRVAKYADRPRQAFEMGLAYGKELKNDVPDIIEAVDVLLPVPMYYLKQLRRGYNQSVEIARGLSEATGIPVGDNLAAVRRHATQTRRSLSERRENVSGLFVCREPDELQGLDVVIVDDVITSGATVSECAVAIGRSGARPASIGALALGLAGG